MQAQLGITCGTCGRYLGGIKVDTADLPEQLQEKVNKVILAHRALCRYYRKDNKIKRRV
ncbi:hypothetical protein ES705_45258 [subsurface metagenome]